MQQTSAIDIFAVLDQCGFHFITVRLSLGVSYFGGMMANVDINVYIIARESLLHPCTVPGRASADVITYKRRPALVRYVTHTRENSQNQLSGARLIIKFAGDLQIAEIVWRQLFCDHSIKHYT